MDYWFEKFAGVLLPDEPRVDAGTGDTRMAILQLPGGGLYDADGSERAPRALARVNMSGIVHASCLSDLRERCNELRALRGVRGALYRRHLDGRSEWITARCMEVAATWTTANRRHAEVELSWVLEGAHWEGEAHDTTYLLDTSPKLIALSNNGNAPANDAVLTLTAVGEDIASVQVQVVGLIDWTWAGSLSAGQSLVVDCGARTMAISGVDAYSQSFGPGQACADWLRLVPGLTTVSITLDRGTSFSVVGTSTLRVQYNDAWE